MSLSPKERKVLAAALAADIIIVDQIIKFLVLKILPNSATINTDISFNIPIPNNVMVFAVPILLVIFAYFAIRYFSWKDLRSIVAFGCFLGGGLGNFVDRIFHGGVIDYLDLGFWPSFNLADAVLTVGAFLLLFFHGKILKDGTR